MDDPHFNPIRNIIIPDAKKQPDRSLAIVLTAVVEDLLGETLKAHLVDHKAADSMFGGMGPLATFSAKIDLGFLMGLYHEDILKLLHAVRKIRNTFAHDMRPLTFESEAMKGKLTGLAYIDRWQTKKRSDRDRFIASLEFTLGYLSQCQDTATPPKPRWLAAPRKSRKKRKG